MRLLVLLLATASLLTAQTRVERGGTVFLTYEARPAEIDLFWKGPDGKPFGQFSKLQEHLRAEGRRIAFIMNAGIFEEGGVPSGLCVIGGKVLHPLNLSPGAGNFFLKPNGVFYIDARGAHVVTSEEYASLKPLARLAIQSARSCCATGRSIRPFAPIPRTTSTVMAWACARTAPSSLPSRSLASRAMRLSTSSPSFSARRAAQTPSSSMATSAACS